MTQTYCDTEPPGATLVLSRRLRISFHGVTPLTVGHTQDAEAN